MNEKGDSTPPKLKLSRDLNPKASPQKPADAGAEKPRLTKPQTQPEKPTLPPLLKKSAPSAAPSNLEDFDPNDPFGDILPKTKPAPEIKKPKTGPALELDRKRSSPLPELPSKPPPPIRNGSGRKLEETLEELQNTGKKHGPSSAPIIIALVLLLVATGAGIWYVLRDGSETAEPSGPTVVDATGGDSETSKKAPTGPIGRTKEMISNRPARVVPGTEETPAASLPPKPPVVMDAPKSTPPAAQTAPKPRRSASAAPAEDLREAVSAFLTSVHVGGIRGGSQPRVMLNGTSYDVNEVVDTNTGLVFSGSQNGRLLFTDRNGIQYVKSF